jgi:DNA-directed RNA polymerase sigma subunit (sigma70/sigma32)
MSHQEAAPSIQAVIKLERARRRLVRENRREPTIDELAAEMKTSREETRRLVEIAQSPITFRAVDCKGPS